MQQGATLGSARLGSAARAVGAHRGVLAAAPNPNGCLLGAAAPRRCFAFGSSFHPQLWRDLHAARHKGGVLARGETEARSGDGSFTHSCWMTGARR